MTKSQIKKRLILQGVNMEHIISIGKDEVEIYVEKQNGERNDSAIRKTTNDAVKALGFGGFKTGYGSFVLRASYQSKGDWNDKSSAHHY